MEANISFPQIGSRIDYYVLDQLVATSTTACIYRATDARTGLQVALKIPHLDIESDPVFYRRLQRERQIGERLDHPSIVKFFGDDKRSRMYLVMEWVEGRPLRHIMAESDRGKLSPGRALRIAVSLCEALEYLHGQGVIHRDLKPENILVSAGDHIRLIDFGIASQDGARRLTFGKLSQVMGTPEYISPEQVQGKRGDARSDIYALGVVLYEMLTGLTPFPADNPFAIMNLRLVSPPVPPCEADPAISAEMQEILYRALEREPKNRYARPREISWDLQHQDQVRIADRTENGRERTLSKSRFHAALHYARVVLLPLSVFAILLYAARHT